MLICGCWARLSDCGAFGFSNEKSLMYCATTLSCGCACGSAWPPLVFVMKSPLGGAWIAWGLYAHKDAANAADRSAFALGPGQRRVRNLVPLLGRQIYHAVPRGRGATQRLAGRPAQWANKQQKRQHIGNKPWN